MSKISIITINLNNLNGLYKTYSSIYSLSLYMSNVGASSLEWIVIDGGSVDGSIQFLEPLPLLSHIVVGQDTSIYNAMNIGIKYSTGDFLLFLNSGDSIYGDFSNLLNLSPRVYIFDSITECTWKLRSTLSFFCWYACFSSKHSLSQSYPNIL